MAKRKPKAVEQLPQIEEIWYVDVERMRTWVENDAGQVIRPHVVLIANGSTGMIMQTELLESAAEDEDILRNLKRVMQGKGQQVKSKPGRPTHVYFRAQLLNEALTKELAQLDIQALQVERPDEIQQMLDQMATLMFDDDSEDLPGLLSVEGVTPEIVAALFAAAADYYRADPWYALTDEMPLAIDVKNGGGERIGIVMGAGGIEYGLAVYQTWADLERLFEFSHNPMQTVPDGGSHSLLFGEIMGLPFDDIDALEEYHWEVAGEEAYPLPVVFHRDEGAVRPTQNDLLWYEAALRAIVRFVEQHGDALEDAQVSDEEAPPLEETYLVQTSSGEREVHITFPAGTMPAVPMDSFGSADMAELFPEFAKMFGDRPFEELFSDDDFDDDDFDDGDFDDDADDSEFELPPNFDRRSMESALPQQRGRSGGTIQRAQEKMYQAWEESNPKRRISLAREALKISPDCADAYVLLAEEESDTPEQALQYYEEGVAAGERALGPAMFEENQGYFWGLLETRPYMRAREGLASVLRYLGRTDEASHHYREILVLNPNDNQGIRYSLLNLLLETGQDDAARSLLDDYAEDGMAEWLYTRALLAFRKSGAGHQADKLLRDAVKINPHVPAYLSGRQRVPAEMPAYIGFGDKNEAISYAAGYLGLWRQTKGAVEWLKKVAK